MDVINLYSMPGCPKCKILKDICNQSVYINDNDFKIMEIDTNNLENDTSYQILKEHNIMDMPVLLVNDTFYQFAEAVQYVRLKDKEYLKDDTSNN